MKNSDHKTLHSNADHLSLSLKRICLVRFLHAASGLSAIVLPLVAHAQSNVAVTTPSEPALDRQSILKSIQVKVEGGHINPRFNEPATYNVTAKCLNGAQVEVWSDLSLPSSQLQHDSQLKILPQPVVATEDFRQALGRLEKLQPKMPAGSTADQAPRFTVPIKVHLHSPQLFSDVAKSLTEATGFVINPAQIHCVVPSFFELVATVGGTSQTIFQVPELNDYSKTNEVVTFNQPSTVESVVTGKVRGSLEELRRFAEFPEMKANILFGAFTTEMNQVVFSANEAFHGSVSTRVFGDDTQRDTLEWSNSSSGHSLMVSLPVLGDGEESSHHSGSLNVNLHRLVSRDFLYQETARYWSQGGIERWGELSAEMQELIGKVTDVFLSSQKLYSAVLREGANKSTEVVVEELKYTRPIQVQQEELELTADTNPEGSVAADSEFEYGKLFKARDKHSFSAKFPSDVKFKRKEGSRFVPTSVKLALLSEADLEAQMRMTVREWTKPTSASFTRTIAAISGAELEFHAMGDDEQTKLISLTMLDEKLRSFHLEHYPIIQTLHGPSISGPGRTDSNTVKVTIDKDGTGQVVLSCGGIGNATGSEAFTVQILKMGAVIDEISVPAVPSHVTQTGLIRIFSVSKTLPIQLRRDTVESLFWPSQIRFGIPPPAPTPPVMPTPAVR